MRYHFENIVRICSNVSYDFQLKQLSDESTLNIGNQKEYRKAGRRELLMRQNKLKDKVKIFLGQMDSQLDEWFSWTLCNNIGYNKHYSILLKDLIDHIELYQQVHGILSDDLSKRVFTDICNWRLCRESLALVDAYSVSKNPQYLEPFEMLTDSETFVDCGGYIGDSTEQLISYVGGVTKVFLYEADEKNINCAKKLLGESDKIVYRAVGVGEKQQILFFSGQGSSSSNFTDIQNTDTCKVEVVAIDEDVPETAQITFLKMDIEGMELQALHGAQNRIKKDRPVLAICVYHKPEDIWEIPLYLYSILGDGYKYYIRHYTMYHGETVFYAVPSKRYK